MLEALFDSVANRATIVAATCNVACALVGTFLVLRRMSLMGDALSHAVLPGLVIALLVSGSTGPLPMLLGALAAGLATTFLTRLTQRHGRVATDASLGVVYTSLFALGVVLVKRYTSDIHFDIACVYEGSLLQVALDTILVGRVEVPRALIVAVPVLVGISAIIVLLWKEWKVATFDPALADTMGFEPSRLHYLLMIMVSVTVMTSFESIGSILVIAMLIAPAAAAQILTDRLVSMLLIAAILAAVATFLGYWIADAMDVSPAGSIAVAAGGLYVAAAMLGPQHGIISRLVQNAGLALRVRREDLLARLYRKNEASPPKPITNIAAVEIAGGGWLGRRALKQLIERGQVTTDAGHLQLTERGEAEGRRLVRSHRLWEAYLVNELGMPSDHVHDPAHRIEHFLNSAIGDEIERTLEGAEDPHGQKIPEKDASQN